MSPATQKFAWNRKTIHHIVGRRRYVWVLFSDDGG